MMMKNEGCLLWERARGLAADRGFEMHGECPIDASCDGSFCVFVSETGDTGPQRVEDFYTRLEKHDALYREQRMRELRHALASACAKTELHKRLNQAKRGEMCGSDPLVKSWPMTVHPHNEKGGPMA